MAGFVVIIPARLASTRLPRKPLADIGGAPMVVRVAEKARAAGALRTVVAADSEEIAAACRSHGVECLLTSADHPTGTDRLSEAARLLQLQPEDIVVNVQGDEPLIPPGVIGQVAAALAGDAACDMATAACPLHADRNHRALYFSRAPIPWPRDAFAIDRARLPDALPARRHIGIYAYRTRFLLTFPTLVRDPVEEFESLEQLRALRHGHRITVVDLSGPLPPGVDTLADLELVRAGWVSQR